MGLVDGSRGRVLYGGILAGIGALVVSSRWFGIGWRTAVDAGAVGLAIGIAIGRLGCLAGGCCTGMVCTMPWGVIYPAAMVDAHGLSYLLPRHPVQVYESILAAAIGCFLIRQHARRAYAGQTALTFLVLYPAARFVVEFWRADDRGELAGVTNATGLSPAQIISFATFAIALPLLVVATRGARRKASATDGPEALERSRPTAVHP
jgi:phosphatidylglycerol:prolipoprotein diacylglycerol transferase